VPRQNRQPAVLTPVLIALALLVAAPAFGQEQDERGERGIAVTPTEPEAASDAAAPPPTGRVDNALPPLADQLPGGAMAPLQRIHVRRVVLDGNTVLPAGPVDELLAEFSDRAVSMEDIHDLGFRLSELYVRNGYVNSGVTLPDQRVDDGVVRLLAVEGEVTRITIAGNRNLRTPYIEKRIRRGIGSPVNAVELQQALTVLRLDPRIARINASLLAGARPGESVLRVDVAEATSYWVNTAFDNYRSPSVDENRVSIAAGNSNFTGNGDVLAIDFGVTDGLDDWSASYAYPLTAADLRIAGYYASTDSEIVEQPFDLIDIQSRSKTAGIALSRPFRGAANRVLTVTAGFENRRAENWLLGMPFSFTPGEQDGYSEVSVGYATAQWLMPAPRRMIALLLSARFGVDVLAPTINPSGPDSTFSSLRAQFQYARAFAWRSSQFVFRSAAQLASSSLLALEKFAVGGHTTVRGYRENTLVRDNGVVASVEWQIPLLVDADGNPTHDVQVTPFIDYGIAWDTGSQLPATERSNLASIGLGVQWRPTPNWLIRADYGYALDDVTTPTESLQDKGLQFRIEYRMTPNAGR